MKGNVIVGQSGGPTAVINASIAGVFHAAKEAGAEHIYGMVHGIQGLLEERVIDMKETIATDLDEELLRKTPSAYLGSCRYKLPKIDGNEETYEKIFAILRKLNIEVFIYTGGNDSMDTIQSLSDYAAKIGCEDIKFVGCPKTIDNDLPVTDHTPGFGSAAKYIGTSMKEIICDTRSIEFPKKLVTIVEIMGRDAGWLTAAAALSRTEECAGPDLIYLPEVAFDMDAFTAKIEALLKEKYSIVVCVSEGIRTADGTYVCELGSSNGYVDAFGHKQLSGTASYLAGYVSGKFGCKTRAVEFSILQRCGAHIASLADNNEAFMCGVCAVEAGIRGETGVMVAMKRITEKPYTCGTYTEDIHKIANGVKSVPREWINEAGDDVKDEIISYLRPLIQGEVTPVMVDGLPRHLVYQGL